MMLIGGGDRRRGQSGTLSGGEGGRVRREGGRLLYVESAGKGGDSMRELLTHCVLISEVCVLV